MPEGKKKAAVGKLPPQPMTREQLSEENLHDLSHERDARCVPLAHELVKMLANQPKMPVGSHVNEKAGEDEDFYRPTVVEFMKLLIEKDVKITEVVYIFQLARQGLQFVEDTLDETFNQNMNRNTESMYGLPHNGYSEVTVKQLNEVAMRRNRIQEVWGPVLAEPVDEPKA